MVNNNSAFHPLKVAQNLPSVSKTYILVRHYNHSLSFDATIMISEKKLLSRKW